MIEALSTTPASGQNFPAVPENPFSTVPLSNPPITERLSGACVFPGGRNEGDNLPISPLSANFARPSARNPASPESILPSWLTTRTGTARDGEALAPPTFIIPPGNYGVNLPSFSESFQSRKVSLSPSIMERINRATNKEFLDAEPPYNPAYHEVLHLTTAFGLQQLNFPVWPESVTIRSPDRIGRNDWRGQVKCLVGKDWWGNPHPAILGIIASASLLEYDGGVKPEGLSSDANQIWQAQSQLASSGWQVKTEEFLRIADIAIREITGPYGNYFLKALAHVLTPPNGEEVSFNSQELFLIINEITRQLANKGIRNDLELMNGLKKTSQPEFIAQAVGQILAEIPDPQDTVPVAIILNPRERQIIFEEDNRGKTCPICQENGGFCPHKHNSGFYQLPNFFPQLPEISTIEQAA